MKVLIAIPASNRLDYGLWESTESPHFNRDKAYLGQGYGRDIHISRDNDRLAVVLDTWAKDVPPEMDLRIFMGGPFFLPVGNFIHLNVEDDYAHLPQKVVAICRWAVEQEYDWMLKVDDDTYVWPQRALEEIRWKQWDYAGYSAHLGSISGGPGYWLSRKAMQIVAESTPHTWAEDKCVEEVLRQNGIKGYALNATHLCGLVEHWVDISRDLSGAVCAHAVKADDMREIYRREHA